MRVLAVEYIENERLLYYSIQDIEEDNLHYIDTDCSRNIKSKYHAERDKKIIWKIQLYKTYSRRWFNWIHKIELLNYLVML